MLSLFAGLSQEVITFLSFLVLLIVILSSWLSTNVREYVFPANLLIIERRSRRFYTFSNATNPAATSTIQHHYSTTFDTGNAGSANSGVRSFQQSTRQSAANTDAAGLSNNNNSSSSSSNSSNGADDHVTPSRHHHQHHHITSISLDRRHGQEFVSEIVEQTLVDDLLDGQLFATNRVESSAHEPATTLRHRGRAHQPIHGQFDSMASSSSWPRDTASQTATAAAETSSSSASTAVSSIETPTEQSTNSQESSSTCVGGGDEANESLINILIRFVNERVMKVQAKPNDTILLLKK